MHRTISFSELPDVILNSLVKANHSVELACNCHLGFAGYRDDPPTLRKILLSVPSGVRARCHLGILESDGEWADDELDRLFRNPKTSITSSLGRWEACVTWEWTGAHYLII